MSIQESKPIGTVAAPAVDPLVLPSHEAAGYIQQMCGELASLAERGGLGFLAYLLEVAREEAILHSDGPTSAPLVMHGELPPQS
ncbi:MAG: hypothetical protein AAF318_04025 [Pseudomonadota bacterium]